MRFNKCEVYISNSINIVKMLMLMYIYFISNIFNVVIKAQLRMFMPN